MRIYTRVLNAEWMLRLGLGAMYIYSGLSLVKNPEKWKWAVLGLPQSMISTIQSIGIERFLMAQGIVEIIFAATFVLWFIPRKISMLCAFLSALEMVFILIFLGVDGGTFRDIGLLGATLGLYVLLKKNS